MGVYIARLREADASQVWAVVDGDRATPIEGGHQSLRDLLLDGREAIAAARKAGGAAPLGARRFAAPLDVSCRLFCLGLNYADHREETGHTARKPAQMLVFGKDAGSLAPPDTDIVKPDDVELLDYEVELGLIIGSDIDEPVQLTDESLGDAVAGFVICNDISARDDQFGVPFMQWYQAKSYRTFCPAGPLVWLPDPGEMERVYDLVVSCEVNGETVQRAPTANFIFRPPEAISRLSRITPLRAGDCLLTGTPGGVALGLTAESQAVLKEHLFQDEPRRSKFVADQLKSGRYLKPGDRVVTRIASEDGTIDLGAQRNTVKAPS